MTEIPIQSDHITPLARMQHVGEWLADERARIEAEMRHVTQQARRHDAELVAFLQRSYGIDAQHIRVAIDADRGVILVDGEPEPTHDMAPVQILPDSHQDENIVSSN